MSRTPEETARLAATVTVETIYGDVGISAEVAMGAARARFHGSDHPRLHALACLAADLAEARAEVAALRQELQIACEALGVANAERLALREHVKMMREWQAAKRATMAAFCERADPRAPDAELKVQLDRNHAARHQTATAQKAIESRMLAADLGEEVGRG